MDAYRDQYAKLFNDGKKVTLLAVRLAALTELASLAKDCSYPFHFLIMSHGTGGQIH